MEREGVPVDGGVAEVGPERKEDKGGEDEEDGDAADVVDPLADVEAAQGGDGNGGEGGEDDAGGGEVMLGEPGGSWADEVGEFGGMA